MEGGGLVVLPRRNFGRICAELWYSGPTWTKNSAYRTVPFLDCWVLEWYWYYYQLFWKFTKGIGCWKVGCIPSECFELTQKPFFNKWYMIGLSATDSSRKYISLIIASGPREVYSLKWWKNKHSKSIAKTIQVPYWLQQIFQEAYLLQKHLKRAQVIPDLYYVDTN